MFEKLRAWWSGGDEPVLFDEPLRSEVLERLRSGDTIGAMKIANRRTGIGLVATKRSVEHLAAVEGLSAEI